MSLFDDLGDILSSFKEAGQELGALKDDIVGSILDLNETVNDSSQQLMGTAQDDSSAKSLPPADE